MIFNKYKNSIYIDMKESLDCFSKNLENINSIDYLFNFKKKLARNFLYFFFIIYFLKPFSSFNFYSTPTNHLKIDVSVLLIIENSCMDNFYNFYI